MINVFNDTLKIILNERLKELESHFDSDVIFYYGEIHPAFIKPFRDFIEKLKNDPNPKEKLTIIINTPGGSSETVEKFVDIVRKHYREVYFVIPDMAMSAGTIFCMSGDKIFMDYSSSLGPIDPQVLVGDKYVPALGYLDKVNELIEKDRNNSLTRAEFAILKDIDLATLRAYEQAKDLTVTLLENWLVEYKFKDWLTHQTNQALLGTPVTLDQKKERAKDIATKLGNNNLWHSHGRMINIEVLKNYLKLKIEDYSDDLPLREKIRSYNDLIIEFILRSEIRYFLHSRNYF